MTDSYNGHRGRRRARRVSVALLTATGVLLFLLGGVAFAGYRYERARADRILPGVRISKVAVGGLTRAEALAALSGVANHLLDRDIKIDAGDKTWHTSPRDLETRVDLEAAVEKALDLNDSYSWTQRLYHRLVGRPLKKRIKVPVFHDSGAVARLVDRLVQRMEVSPVNASIDFVGDSLVVQHSRAGRSLDVDGAEKSIMSALRHRRSWAGLLVERVNPSLTEEDFGELIVVRISENRLRLFDGTDLVRTYPVATGQRKYPTPKGHFEIINKRINPTWINPARDTWGKDEPKEIPPGPDNPLGTRALDIDSPGIRIHGTYDADSIGTYASHGCIRMHLKDSEDLFGRVEVGTPVIITY